MDNIGSTPAAHIVYILILRIYTPDGEREDVGERKKERKIY